MKLLLMNISFLNHMCVITELELFNESGKAVTVGKKRIKHS